MSSILYLSPCVAYFAFFRNFLIIFSFFLYFIPFLIYSCSLCLHNSLFSLSMLLHPSVISLSLSKPPAPSLLLYIFSLPFPVPFLDFFLLSCYKFLIIVFSHSQSYGTMPLDQDEYEGQTVLILGGGTAVMFSIPC